MLVFENQQGHSKIIKANQVKGVEPLNDDQRGFKIVYEGHYNHS